MPDTPSSGGRGVANLPYLGVLSAMPTYFDLDPDGALTDAAIDRKRQEAKDRQTAEREAALLGALAAEKRGRAEELAEAKRQADNDALLASLTRLATPPAPKPRSQRVELAEAAEERWQETLANQKRRWPPHEYPELYSHLDPEDVPELFDDEDELMDDDGNTEPAPTPLKSLLAPKHVASGARQPNGHSTPEPDEPVQGMPLPVKWSLAALGLGALVAMIVRFPLR